MQVFFPPLRPCGDFLAGPVHAHFSGCLRDLSQELVNSCGGRASGWPSLLRENGFRATKVIWGH